MLEWFAFMVLVGFPWAVTVCWMVDGMEWTLKRVSRPTPRTDG